MPTLVTAAVPASCIRQYQGRVLCMVLQIPFCVVYGWIIQVPMDLNFKIFETASLCLTVLVVAALLQVRLRLCLALKLRPPIPNGSLPVGSTHHRLWSSSWVKTWGCSCQEMPRRNSRNRCTEFRNAFVEIVCGLAH